MVTEVIYPPMKDTDTNTDYVIFGAGRRDVIEFPDEGFLDYHTVRLSPNICIPIIFDGEVSHFWVFFEVFDYAQYGRVEIVIYQEGIDVYHDIWDITGDGYWKFKGDIHQSYKDGWGLSVSLRITDENCFKIQNISFMIDQKWK